MNNFPSVFSYLTDGRACKRGTWGGYLKKEQITETSGSTTTVIGYYYTFVCRNGAQYIYKYLTASGWSYIGYVAAGASGALAYATAAAAVAASAPVVGTTLDFDVDLFEGMTVSDWSYGTTSDYETARIGGSGRW